MSPRTFTPSSAFTQALRAEVRSATRAARAGLRVASAELRTITNATRPGLRSAGNTARAELRALGATARTELRTAGTSARAELRVLGDTARTELRTASAAAREAARKPSRLAAAGVIAATVGAVTAAAVAAPAAGATASPGSPPAASSLSDAAVGGAASGLASPATFYDAVHQSAIPAGQAVAAYSDGAYAASHADVAGRSQVMWIDVNGSNTNASALDVEPGDATPAGAAAWVSAKLANDPSATPVVYTFKADWSAVKADIDALPGNAASHVKYWIADPTGVKHILPGSDATQWYWGANYDISAANPGFFQ